MPENIKRTDTRLGSDKRNDPFLSDGIIHISKGGKISSSSMVAAFNDNASSLSWYIGFVLTGKIMVFKQDL